MYDLPKKFYYRQSLQRHETFHTGEKPYACNFCDKKFTRMHKQKNHEKTHTEDNLFSCQKCDKTYVSQFHARNVLNSIHLNFH